MAVMTCTDGVVAVTMAVTTCTDGVVVTMAVTTRTDGVAVTMAVTTCTDGVVVTMAVTTCTDGVVAVTMAVMTCTDGVVAVTMAVMTSTDGVVAVTMAVTTCTVLLLQVDTADAQRILLQAGSRSRRHLADHDPSDSNDNGTCLFRLQSALSATLPPNPAVTGYATEGALLVSARLSTEIAPINLTP